MEFINGVFGESGLAQTFLNNQWFLVGLLLLIILLVYFYGKRMPAEGLVFLLFAGIVLLTIDELFKIPDEIIIFITVVVLLLVGFYAYFFLNK